MTGIKTAATAALGVLTCALAAGCGSGPSLSEVSGKVTLDGKPTPGLEVRFDPAFAGATTAVGYTQADGGYKLSYPGGKTGTPPGDYSVKITVGELDGTVVPTAKVAEKYNTSTTLKATVTPGPNTVNFDVTSK